MAVTSSSLGIRRADNDVRRNQTGHIVYYATGSAGTGAAVTFAENVQGFTIANTSANWVRARVVFDASVTSAVPVADRVMLLPPESTHQVDYGQNNTDDASVGFVEPVTGVEIDVVDVSGIASGAATNAGALATLTSVPSATYVTINAASA